jgi:hypothetical protein
MKAATSNQTWTTSSMRIVQNDQPPPTAFRPNQFRPTATLMSANGRQVHRLITAAMMAGGSSDVLDVATT